MSQITTVYSFTPSANACTACASRQRYSIVPQARPHPNCKCTIDSFVATVSLVAQTEFPYFPPQITEELIGMNTPNDCFTEIVTITATEELGWEIGHKGVKISGGEGLKVTKSHKQDFCHSGNCEGTEAIYAIYEVTEYLIESLYVAKSVFFGPDDVQWMEHERRVEIKQVNLKSRCI